MTLLDNFKGSCARPAPDGGCSSSGSGDPSSIQRPAMAAPEQAQWPTFGLRRQKKHVTDGAVVCALLPAPH